MFKKILLLEIIVVSLICSSKSSAQISDGLKDGLKFYINRQDSTKFVKLNMTSQFWARFTDFNPNSNVNGVKANSATDFSIRRLRFVFSGELTDRINFFVQFGQNNLNYLSSRKTGSFFHDITADYQIVKNKISIGGGLNGWNGPSRFSNASIASLLVLDPPAYQEVTNDTYDQFVKRLGVYVKGKLGQFDYRVSVGKPFAIQTASNMDPMNHNSSFSTLPPQLVYQGYIMYQFLDQESNFGSGTTGTYLGKKRVLNIGAGFYSQKDAMYRISDVNKSDTVNENIRLFAFDLFYDAPLNKASGNAISFYACYSKYNFGQNFIKVGGHNNPANGTSINNPTLYEKNNFGNAYPYLGTGDILYFQAGYKFRNNLLGDFGTLQPFLNCQYSDYDALSSKVYLYEAGINWLLKGNNSKLTLNYQNRPYFSQNSSKKFEQSNRQNEYVIQYQLSF